MKLIVYAPRIHTGGGLVLLRDLVDTPGLDLVAIVDSRAQFENEAPAGKLIRIPSGVRSYLIGEKVLHECVRKFPDSIVLCFSSLPPLRRPPVRTLVFIQNRFVVEDLPCVRFSLKVSLRHKLERLLFKVSHGNADGFVVQTQSMARVIQERFPEAMVHVMPFIDKFMLNLQPTSTLMAEKRELDLVYVASPDPHKNHLGLLEAWEILARDSVFPSLGLTVSADDALGVWGRAERLNKDLGTRIHRLEPRSDQDRRHFYKCARGLIFPSFFETFGLPLLEAHALGMPILAPELDYVRDSVVPTETFDPASPVSISRAVRRWLGVPQECVQPTSSSNFAAWIELIDSENQLKSLNCQ